MKKKLSKVMEQMETGEISPREIILTVAVAFLSGALLGIIFSPKKHVVIASNNGSNNNDNSCDWDFEDEFEDDED